MHDAHALEQLYARVSAIYPACKEAGNGFEARISLSLSHSLTSFPPLLLLFPSPDITLPFSFLLLFFFSHIPLPQYLKKLSRLLFNIYLFQPS